MSRQNASRKMFGLIMLTITLLLVACGTDDGDTTPTATSAADSAVPTLPTDDATASLVETEEISEEDLTVVTPDIPATATEDEIVATAAVVTPAGLTSTPATPATEASAAVEPTAAVGTPAEVTGVVGSPVAETVATADVAPAESEDAAASATPTAAADATVELTPDTETTEVAEGETFNTPGDGTGGSGQPGERSSNVPGQATPSASPVAGLSVEGCEVPNVPEFTGATTAYVTVAEVNFRSGPGVDCSPILEDPLAEGIQLTVLGGPVTQSADGSQWLQIEVDGIPGWVTTEFVEPTE